MYFSLATDCIELIVPQTGYSEVLTPTFIPYTIQQDTINEFNKNRNIQLLCKNTWKGKLKGTYKILQKTDYIRKN
jgi:hypothetical protein